MEEVRGKVRDILFYERYFEIFFSLAKFEDTGENDLDP